MHARFPEKISWKPNQTRSRVHMERGVEEEREIYKVVLESENYTYFETLPFP